MNCYSEYLAAVGGKVALPCNTSIWGEDLISLVLWYKENSGSGLPIYSVDARITPLSKSKHSIAQPYRNRFYFDVSLKPPLLTIDPVLESDVGDYRCRVDYRKSRTKNFVAKLQIIVPPKEVIITDSEGQRLEGTVGPYDEGSDLNVICEADGGKPPPSVFWWINDVLLDSSYSAAPHGHIRNELRLSTLNRSDFQTEITCKASNTNLTVPKQSSIILDMNLKPLEVKITTVAKPLSVGQHSELQCLSYGSRPPAKISWWKGTQKMVNVRDTVSSDENVTLSTVSFIPVIKDNGKYISCRADNLQMEFSALEDGRVLNVHFVPQLSVSLGAKILEDSVKEGNDVYIECNIVANPWVSSVTWFFEEEPLISNPSEGIIVANQSLVLQKVKRQRSGRYFCVATNSEGQGQSPDFYLKINFAPICKAGQKIIYGVVRNEIAHISCEVEAQPKNVIFRWSLNASSENVEIRSFVSNGTQSIATYVPRTRFGYGALACWAENDVGRQAEPCIYNIIPTGPPEAVKNCFISNHSQTSLVVDCIAGETGGLQQIFVAEVYNPILRTLYKNVTSLEKPSFNIQNLPSGSTFKMSIYAINAKGKSEPYSLTADTLGEPEKQTANEELIVSPLLGILIGVITTTSLIFIVILCLKLRSNRNRRPKDLDNGKKSSPRLYSKNEDVTVNRIDLSRGAIHANNGYLKSPLQAMYGDGRCGTHGHYGQEESLNAGMSFKGIRVPDVTDVTYAELSLLPSHTMASISRKMLGEPEPCEYASINFQMDKYVAKEDVVFDEMKRRESPIADGCSETEVSFETPLIESLRPGFRSHDIIIRRLSPSDQRTATPV